MRRIRALQASNSPRRRAAVIVLTVVTVVVLIGFAALTIDIGYMYSVRIDLQNAADAAAMTAATAYGTDLGTDARTNKTDAALSKLRYEALERATSLSALNPSMGRDATILDIGDLTLGYINVLGKEPLNSGADLSLFNAVHVVARRDAAGPNGVVELFFSRVFGYYHTEVTASAVAAFDDRVAVVEYSPFIPFTIHKDLFESQVTSGSDAYEYDADSESVSKGEDGIREIKMFPHDTGAGNFGLLNIGPDSSSATQPNQQIGENIMAEHMEVTFGTPDFHFVNDQGEPATYDVPGTPGLKASLEGVLQSRVGEVVGIFLHDGTSGNGSNLTYEIVGIRFVRIMAVNLSSNPKSLSVQPVIWDGESVILGENAPGTDGFIGNIVLAR